MLDVATTSVSAHEPMLVSYRLLAESFRRKLLAENKSPNTIQTYSGALTLFGDFLVSRGMPTEPGHIHREHVESFIVDLLERYRPATASNRYRALATFFKWLVEEGELRESPMTRMQPPHVPEEPPDVLTEEQLHRLLKACEGKDFEARRDTAILRLFLDTGMRLAELTGSAWTMSTLSRTSRTSSARAAGRERVRLGAARP